MDDRPDKWTYTGENFEKSFTLIGQNIMSSINLLFMFTYSAEFSVLCKCSWRKKYYSNLYFSDRKSDTLDLES